MAKKAFYKNKTLKFLIFILILVSCWLLGKYLKFDVEYCRAYLEQYPIEISGLIYIVIFVALTMLIWFGPKDVFKVAGAILFGATISTVLVLIAESINACLLFYLSRSLGREYVVQKFKLKTRDIDKMGDDTSFIGAFSLRFNPLIPFRLMDLGAGLSGISFQKYFVVVLLASPIRIYWQQWILHDFGGQMMKDPLALYSHISQRETFLFLSLIYFTSVVVLSIIAAIVKLSKKKKKMETAHEIS